MIIMAILHCTHTLSSVTI